VRWVHSTELTDPDTVLKGGELLPDDGHPAGRPKAQRELMRLPRDHEIVGLGFVVPASATGNCPRRS